MFADFVPAANERIFFKSNIDTCANIVNSKHFEWFKQKIRLYVYNIVYMWQLISAYL